MSETVDLVAVVLEQLAENPDACSRFSALLADNAPARTLHTSASLAAELGVSARTITRAIENGELAATRRAGRWVMTVEDARSWATSGARARRTGTVSSLPRPAARRGVMAEAMRERDAA